MPFRNLPWWNHNWGETILGTSIADWLSGTSYNDWLYGYSGNDTIFGGAGNDHIYGGAGDDILLGESGNDTFHGDAGADKLYGGRGFDTVDYRDADSAVVVNLEHGRGYGSDAEGDTYSSIEKFFGTDFHDSFRGNDANNHFVGGFGNDRFAGSLGADIHNGGYGVDEVTYASSDEAIHVNLKTGEASGGEAEGDTLISIEDLIGTNHDDVVTGSDFANFMILQSGDDWVDAKGGNDEIFADWGNDTVYGGYGHDKLHGGDNDDRLFGNQGNDELHGGDGDDWLYGGSGADKLVGGEGQDWAQYALNDDNVNLSTERVIVDLHAGLGFGGNAEGDTLSGIENLWGTDENDILRGSEQANQLYGDWGDDRLVGRGGDDYLTGAGGDDTMEGGAGNDQLVGEWGDDVLDGGAGADYLSGSLGSDTFVYKNATDSTAENFDTVGGWDHQWTWAHGREYDKFDFTAIDANDQIAGNQALEFIDEAAFTDVGQIQQLKGGAVTWVRVNLDSDFSDAEMVIKVDQAVDFNDWDFIV